MKKEEVGNLKLLRFIQLLGGMMKRTVLNVLLLFCFVFSVKAQEEKLGLVKRVIGWGQAPSLALAAKAHGIPYTLENRKLLQAAKAKNMPVIREILRKLNRDLYGTTNLAAVKKIQYRPIQLGNTKERSRSDAKWDSWAARDDEAKRAWGTYRKAEAELKEIAKKDPTFIEKNKKLLWLYAAVVSLYFKENRFDRFFPLFGFSKNDQLGWLWAAAESFNKKFNILDTGSP